MSRPLNMQFLIQPQLQNIIFCLKFNILKYLYYSVFLYWNWKRGRLQLQPLRWKYFDLICWTSNNRPFYPTLFTISIFLNLLNWCHNFRNRGDVKVFTMNWSLHLVFNSGFSRKKKISIKYLSYNTWNF